MQNNGLLDKTTLALIENVKMHPEVYKTDHQLFQSMTRLQKQRLWDTIARTSGFGKTEDAKSKWRSLNIYLRQHTENVMRRKLRRYIPNTGNSEDKYIQLQDWRYYDYIKYMAPYLRKSQKTECNSASEQTLNDVKTTTLRREIIPAIGSSITECEMANINIDNIIVGREVDRTTVIPRAQFSLSDSASSLWPSTLSHNSGHCDSRESLRLFFDAMQLSIQRLPLFHRERVKKKLLDAICKERNE